MFRMLDVDALRALCRDVKVRHMAHRRRQELYGFVHFVAEWAKRMPDDPPDMWDQPEPKEDYDNWWTKMPPERREHLEQIYYDLRAYDYSEQSIVSNGVRDLMHERYAYIAVEHTLSSLGLVPDLIALVWRHLEMKPNTQKWKLNIGWDVEESFQQQQPWNIRITYKTKPRWRVHCRWSQLSNLLLQRNVSYIIGWDLYSKWWLQWQPFRLGQNFKLIQTEDPGHAGRAGSPSAPAQDSDKKLKARKNKVVVLEEEIEKTKRAAELKVARLEEEIENIKRAAEIKVARLEAEIEKESRLEDGAGACLSKSALLYKQDADEECAAERFKGYDEQADEMLQKKIKEATKAFTVKIFNDDTWDNPERAYCFIKQLLPYEHMKAPELIEKFELSKWINEFPVKDCLEFLDERDMIGEVFDKYKIDFQTLIVTTFTQTNAMYPLLERLADMKKDDTIVMKSWPGMNKKVRKGMARAQFAIRVVHLMSNIGDCIYQGLIEKKQE